MREKTELLKKIILKVVIPVVIIIVGLGIMKMLFAKRPVPHKEVREHPGVLVQVLAAEKRDHRMSVDGTGTVEAGQEVSVLPQVSGHVVHAAFNLKTGGFFKKDRILFSIDDTDYRLALESAAAARAKAEYELAKIESQALIARSEWERMNSDGSAPANPLVLYEPQLKNAKASLASASAAVKRARLDLARTKVRAPFNCRVRSEDIAPGQYVKAGTSVAVLAGTDTSEVAVPMALDDMKWIDIPGPGEKGKGSQAFVRMMIGGESHEWEGRVTRSSGEVDPRTRMMQVIVEIKDPYGLEKRVRPGSGKTKGRPALASGMFVNVTITGRTLKDAFVIPRTAFRDGSTVWVMDSEDRLHIKKVDPARIERTEVIISGGLDQGDRIILTNISGAAEGMKLRTMERLPTNDARRTTKRGEVY